MENNTQNKDRNYEKIVEEIIEIELTDSEKAELHKSAEDVKVNIEKLNSMLAS